MNARLQRMHQSSLTEAAASDRAKSERLVSQCCLASFLSFFTFSVHAGSPPSDASACHAHFQPGTDLSAALYAAALAKSLEWVVPWVVHYVRFASQDSDAEQSCCIQQLLQQLSSIKSCKALLPKSAQFGAVASCLRCVLDDHLEQSAEIERSVSEADAAWLSALQDWESTAQLQGPVLDARYLHLCCPLLEQARQAIQVKLLDHSLSTRPTLLPWKPGPDTVEVAGSRLDLISSLHSPQHANITAVSWVMAMRSAAGQHIS